MLRNTTWLGYSERRKARMHEEGLGSSLDCHVSHLLAYSKDFTGERRARAKRKYRQREFGQREHGISFDSFLKRQICGVWSRIYVHICKHCFELCGKRTEETHISPQITCSGTWRFPRPLLEQHICGVSSGIYIYEACRARAKARTSALSKSLLLLRFSLVNIYI